MICTASAQESVPRWMAGQGRGWVTAEYGMLPASTGDRKQRDVSKGRPDGRTVEIQRLIGRSLRGVVDFGALGERTIYLDCDVLQADGGTRCASITGAYVALALACSRLRTQGLLERSPLTGSVAAVSCGIVDGVPLLDLDYSEDSTAEVDANVVMTGDGGLVEVQATAERTPAVARASRRAARARGQRHRRAARGSRRLRSTPARDVRRLVLATRNAHKVREFEAAARRRTESSRCPTTSSCRPRTARRSPTTRWSRPAPPRGPRAARRSPTTRGIEAAALGGAPGVRSARFAGEDATDEENLAKLLREAPAGSARRVRLRARLRRPGAGEEEYFEGRCPGTLAAEPRGTAGFGYDPAFVPDDFGDGRTMAELDPAEKDAISHRGRAARALLDWLEGR